MSLLLLVARMCELYGVGRRAPEIVDLLALTVSLTNFIRAQIPYVTFAKKSLSKEESGDMFARLNEDFECSPHNARF